jgi:hypothetical protein
MGEYKHAEAFAVMKYQDSVTGNVEMIWNSRDGVTPFIVFSRAGNEARHIDWRSDKIDPDHVPDVGDRIFVDLTMERCRELNREMVEKRWEGGEYPMKDRFDSKEEAIEQLSISMFDNGRQPDIVVVTEEIRQRFVTKGESGV